MSLNLEYYGNTNLGAARFVIENAGCPAGHHAQHT